VFITEMDVVVTGILN